MTALARSPVLVARGAELAVGARLAAGATRGAGATLLVTGEAGVGKSRLVAEIAARCGLTVLTGRAVVGGGAYRPIAEALAVPLRCAPALEGEGLRPFRAALRLLHGGLVRGGTRGLAGGVDPTVVLGEGVLALLRASCPAGVVLVLEDLHWADADTLGLVGYLADAAPGAALLLALTARTDSGPGVLADLATRPSVTTAPLGPLDTAGVAALAAACRGGAPLPGPELDALVARSDGLPFLVEELLDRAGGGAEGVPPTLAGLVASRMAALPQAAREVVRAAAVIGADPDWRVLAAVTGDPEPAVVAALRAAADAGLLVADAGRMRFRHALTRDAVLATLLPPERATLAAAAARVLQAGGPEDRAAAAELLVTAGRPDRAAALLVDLARHDAARGALRTAVALLDRAVAAGGDSVTVALERVRVLTQAGRAADALEAGAAALDTGGLVGDRHAELCLRLARAAVVGGRWEAARGWLDRAGRPDDPRSLVLAADAAFGSGDVERAAALAQAAVRAAEDAMAAAGGRRDVEQGAIAPGKTAVGAAETDLSPTMGRAAAGAADRSGQVAATVCEALLVLGRTSWRTGVELPEAAFRRAAQVAAEHGLMPARVEATFQLGACELNRGDPIAPSLSAAAELAVQAGTLLQAVQADLLRTEATLVVDGPRAARPVADRAAALAGRLRLSSLQAMSELMAALSAALAGDGALAEALLGSARSRPDAPVEVATSVPVVRALRHLLAHDLPRAAALVDEGMTPLLRHGSAASTCWFGLWVLLRSVVGDRDADARAQLRRHHTGVTAHNRAALDYAEAVAAGRAGDRAAAAAGFAVVDARLAHLPWWNRLLRLLALEAAVADGWGDPVPALRADLAAHEQAGDTAFARTCRDLLRTAGAPTRRRGRAPVPPGLRARGVTGREAEVLTLVADGLTNAEVARRLFLSPRTVETHVASLLAKTGAAGRAELRAWATDPSATR